MVKKLLYVVGGLVAVVVLVTLIGLMMPKGHRASRTITLRAAPPDVFAVISDFARYSEWRSDVQRVEVLPDTGQGQMIREYGKNGTIPYRVEVFQPPSRMVMRIADPSLPFGGTWTFELEPSDAKTDLTLTEDGEVYNPIFRFISKVFISEYATIDTYLADLRKRLGE